MYIQPAVRCKFSHRDHVACNPIVLPLSNLDRYPDDDEEYDPSLALEEEDDDGEEEWPEHDWQAYIGCPSCGRLYVYSAWNVSLIDAPYKGRGQFRSDTVCVSVEYECARADCRTPIKFHTTIGDRSQKAFDELRDKLQSGFFFGTCPKGHSMLPIPKSRYRIQEVLDKIPTDPTLTQNELPPSGWEGMLNLEKL